MKKIMSLMLGLCMVVGAASFALAQDSQTGTDKKTTKKKGKKKKGGDTGTTSPRN